MKLTLGQAAIEANVSKPTLSRAIKSGKLSAEKLSDGSFAIDPSELFRVYPRNSNAKQPMKQSTTPNETPKETHVTDSFHLDNVRLQAENEGLKRDVARLEERIIELKQERDELKQERDDWKAQAAVVNVIKDMRSQKGFWSFFKKS